MVVISPSLLLNVKKKISDSAHGTVIDFTACFTLQGKEGMMLSNVKRKKEKN